MRLFLSNEDHFKHLNECVAAHPRLVNIATYGIWAGITADGRDTRDWGEKYRSESRELLESMRGKVGTVRVLVGLYEYKSCRGKGFCQDCETKYVRDLFRLMNHAEVFPTFLWKVSSESHAKCTIFHYENEGPRAVTGGRNLTDSSWADVTVELDKMSTLRLDEHFMKMWDSGTPLTPAKINKVVEAQGISKKTLDNLLATA